MKNNLYLITKSLKVIRSCTTMNQLNVAKNYVLLVCRRLRRTGTSDFWNNAIHAYRVWTEFDQEIKTQRKTIQEI